MGKLRGDLFFAVALAQILAFPDVLWSHVDVTVGKLGLFDVEFERLVFLGFCL
jgi:hypothetical protein